MTSEPKPALPPAPPPTADDGFPDSASPPRGEAAVPPPRPHRSGGTQEPRVSVRVHLQVDDAPEGLERFLSSRLKQLAGKAGVTRAAIAIAVVGDAHMARMHKQFAGVPGTTDVLTFDLRDHPTAKLEADIVLCLDQARRQARARGHAVQLELLLYALHGLLHLLGYDDHSPRKRFHMHQREDQLLRAVGLPAVYNRPETSRKPHAQRRPSQRPGSHKRGRSRRD